MPAQQRARFDNHQCVFPILHAAGEHEEPETLAVMEVRSLALARENGELLAQEGVFGDQFGFAEGEVSERPAHKCNGRRMKASSVEWFEPVGKCAKEGEEEEKVNERCG